MEVNGIYFNMYGIIYKITNLITLERYVGKTVGTLKKRWNRHCRESACPYIHRAIVKYGKENFDIKIIMYANSKEELSNREKFCVKIFNTEAPNGYNLTSGGDEGIRSDLPGRVLTKQEKYKISITLKEFYKDPKNKMDCAMSRSGRKEIICHQNGITYISVRQAARDLNLSSSSKILDVINKTIKSYKGYTFSLVKDVDLNNFKSKDFESTIEDIKISVKCNENGIIYKSMRAAAIDLNLKSDSKICDIIKGKIKHYKGYTFSIVNSDGTITDPVFIKKPNLKKILVKCNESEIVYESISVAAKSMNLPSESKISDILNGKLKHYKGYTFSRVEIKNEL